ncbi:MAG: hypothetical protein ACE5F1_08060 [Planctomycetota bacterium]
MRALAVVLLIPLTGALPAQTGVSATFVSATEMKATVWSLKKEASVPANTDLTKGLALSVGTVANGNRSFGFADASTAVKFRHSPPAGTLASISDSSSAGGHNPSMAATTGLSSPREHVTRLVFKAAKPVKAKLILSADWSGWGYRAAAYGYYASVHLGNSKVLWTGAPGSKSEELVVSIDAKGLVLTTRTYSEARNYYPFFGNASATGTLTIRLLPALDCSTGSYGRSCGPLLMQAPITFNSGLELRLWNAAPSAFGKLVIGLKPLDIRIPGTTCFLHTDIQLLLPFVTDNLGQAIQRLPIPPGLKLGINVQDVVFQRKGNGFVITSTNGLKVDCK